MTKQDGLKIGLALNHIAMSVGDTTLKKIKPFLDTIEEICVKEVEKDEKE